MNTVITTSSNLITAIMADASTFDQQAGGAVLAMIETVLARMKKSTSQLWKRFDSVVSFYWVRQWIHWEVKVPTRSCDATWTTSPIRALDYVAIGFGD